VNWLDVILALILFISTAMSFARGFIRELAGLISSVLALVLGMWFYASAGRLVEPWVGSHRGANLIGFCLVVGCVLVLGGIIGWVVSRFVKTIGLSFVDRLLGAAFGFVRGALIAIALVTALLAFGPHEDSGIASSAMVHSRIAPWVLEASQVAVAVAPAELKQTFRKYYTQIREVWQDRPSKRADKDS
jgi:membrane protein required for colicin V production